MAIDDISVPQSYSDAPVVFVVTVRVASESGCWNRGSGRRYVHLHWLHFHQTSTPSVEETAETGGGQRPEG